MPLSGPSYLYDVLQYQVTGGVTGATGGVTGATGGVTGATGATGVEHPRPT